MAQAFINIDIGAFVCEAPVFNNSTFSGVRYVFTFDWNSEGNYYSTLDPTTHMELSMVITEIANNTLIYSGVVDNNVPFNTNTYDIDILDYYLGFSNKYRVDLTLTMVNNIGCNNSTNYTIPVNSYP